MLSSLPNELLNDILLQTPPSALALLCRTSKTILPVARLYLYRHVTVTLREDMSEAYEYAPEEEDHVSVTSADCWLYNADDALCRCLRRYTRISDLVETITIRAESEHAAPEDMLPPIVKHLLRSCRNATAFRMPSAFHFAFTYNMEKVALSASDGLGPQSKLETVTLPYSGGACMRFLQLLPALRALTLADHCGDEPSTKLRVGPHFPFRLEVLRLKSPDLHPNDLFAMLKSSLQSLHTLELPVQNERHSDLSPRLSQFTALTSLRVQLEGFQASATILPIIFRNVGAGSPHLRHVHLSHSFQEYFDYCSGEDSDKATYLDSTLLQQLPISLQSLRLSIVPVMPSDLAAFIASGRCPNLYTITFGGPMGGLWSEKDWTAALETARKAGVVLEKDRWRWE